MLCQIQLLTRLSQGLTASSYIQPHEANDPGVALGTRALRVPFARSLGRLHALSYRVPLLRFHPFQPADPLYASLVEGWHVHSGQEHYTAVGARDAYRREWFDFWKAQDLDFVLTVPNALPAVRHGGNKEGWKACGYTFLFNVVSIALAISVSCISPRDVLICYVKARLCCWRASYHARRPGARRPRLHQ